MADMGRGQLLTAPRAGDTGYRNNGAINCASALFEHAGGWNMGY